MKKGKNKKTVVIYHASCKDGFGAAWAAWKKFGARAEYHPKVHYEAPLKLAGRDIYFLDFSYEPKAMRRLAKKNRVTVIDHHVTAKAAVAEAHDSLYDIEHSGAVLAWKYFHPRKPLPRLLRHIEDKDLWKFKLHDTAAVGARMDLVDSDFKKWDKAIRDFEKPKFRKAFVQEGRLLDAYRTRAVRMVAERNAAPVNFLGYRVLAVNDPRFTSDVGNLLCRMKPPMGIVWHENMDVIHVSLRSNGSVDVSKIAQRFGGGGHKHAAAFNLPLGSKKPWTHLKK